MNVFQQHPRRRERHAGLWYSARCALAGLLVGLAACHPQHVRPRPHAPVARAHATKTPTPQQLAASPRPAPSPVLEEQNLGEEAALTPPPATGPAQPPAELAAVPPQRPQAPPAALVPAESDSLLHLIGPKTPPNTVASLRLIEEGRQQMNQEHYGQALDRFERGVTIDPTNAYGYYFLARLNYQLKKYDQAIAFAGRAVALGAHLDPEWQARAHSLQGAVYEQVGRYPDARRAYQKAVAADPSNATARNGMARLGGQ